MKKISMTVIGFSAFVFALSLNFRYALNDYGIIENTLATAVLAQTSSTGGGSNSNSNSNSNSDSNTPEAKYKKVKGDCEKVFTIEGTVDDPYVTLFGEKWKLPIGSTIGGSYTAKYTKVEIDCQVGTESYTCTDCTCGSFWTGKC